MKNPIKKFMKNIYLSMSDCDGMCNYCDPHLKKLCQEKKQSPINNHQSTTNNK